MLNPWLATTLYAAIIGAMMATLRGYQRRRSPHPEWVRKLAHVGTGLITLTLPWAFHTAWPVLLLAAGSMAALLALKFSAPLKNALSGVLDGVERASGGEIYFPLSVGILFVLTKGDRMLFSIPILILTFADAVAALAGAHYGLHRYDAADVKKSAEGSVAFFTVAFLSTHIPLLLFTDVGRAKTLLIGLTMGLVMMLLEAIAWRGLDNLFIPIGGFLLLELYLQMDERALLARFCVTLVLVVLVLLYRHHTTLEASALLGAAFIGYVTWALGGWQWLVPPAVLFVTYTMLSPRTEWNSARIHNIHAVFTVASAGLVWLSVGSALHNSDYYYPYTLAFAAHLGIIGVARLGKAYPGMPVPALLGTCISKGWLLIFLPYFLVQGMTRNAGVRAGAGLAGVAIAALLFYHLQPRIDDCPIDRARWLRQAGIAALSSTLGLIPIYLA